MRPSQQYVHFCDHCKHTYLTVEGCRVGNHDRWCQQRVQLCGGGCIGDLVAGTSTVESSYVEIVVTSSPSRGRTGRCCGQNFQTRQNEGVCLHLEHVDGVRSTEIGRREVENDLNDLRLDAQRDACDSASNGV